MENEAKIQQLLQHYMHNRSTPQETEQLLQLIETTVDAEFWERMVLVASNELPVMPVADATAWEPFVHEIIARARNAEKDIAFTANGVQKPHVLSHSNNSGPAAPQVHFLKTSWFRYAAVAILALCTGAYIWLQRGQQPTLVDEHKQVAQDVAPGKEGAILTLADGTQLLLDSLGNGVVATQNGSEVVWKNGQLAYTPIETGVSVASANYNSISTPKGRQFSLRLPDGTQVWLNAASTLRYPTQFAGNNRTVEIIGEAYFEVVQKAHQPFLLHVNNQATIEVLGTSFNVNAYENEASIHTTLVEGSVRVGPLFSKTNTQYELQARNEKRVILQPGQQAAIANVYLASHQPSSTSPNTIVVTGADVDKVMAWKHGFFSFQDANLQVVMKQLERWYDIEVVYEKGIPDIRFTGKISRKSKLSWVLKGLEELGVHFRIEAGRVVVLQ